MKTQKRETKKALYAVTVVYFVDADSKEQARQFVAENKGFSPSESSVRDVELVARNGEVR